MSDYKLIADGVPCTDHQKSKEDRDFNVRRMLLFSGLYGAASAIATMGVFDAYIYVQSRNSNKAVGWAESASGISQIIVAFPAGYLVDKVSRALIISYCGIVSVIYSLFFIAAIYYDSRDFIYALLAIGGVLGAVQSTATFSLYADSVPQGFRAKAMMEVAVVTQLSMAIGPVVSMVLFFKFGDEWELPIMHSVLFVGFTLMIPGCFYLIGWRDIETEELIEEDETVDEDLKHQSYSTISNSCVPYMICFNDFITCVGAGMTVKFLPLFFKNEYRFTPCQVQALYAVYLLLFGIFTWLCQQVAARLGRVQAALLFSFLGVSCLFALASVTYLPVVLIVFLLRGALQNSIYPIDRSIIMDFVHSKSRVTMIVRQPFRQFNCFFRRS